MADVELMIKIPEEEYRWIKQSDKTVFADVASKECMLHAIKNGKPIPNYHGKLKDADELYSIFKKLCNDYNIDNLSFISDMDMNFDLASTFVEANNAENDE
jgi:hypothetical protein